MNLRRPSGPMRDSPKLFTLLEPFSILVPNKSSFVFGRNGSVKITMMKHIVINVMVAILLLYILQIMTILSHDAKIVLIGGIHEFSQITKISLEKQQSIRLMCDCDVRPEVCDIC